MYARDERTGFQSIKNVWNEMGWDGEKIWRDTVANSQTTKAFNSFLFQDNLMPRLVAPRADLRAHRAPLPGDRAADLKRPASLSRPRDF